MDEIDIPDDFPSWVKDHIELYLTDPEQAHLWDGSLGRGHHEGLVPTLLLISTGRKSGKRRPLPLIYVKNGDRYAIVASKGGYPTHPAWYVNRRAQPECEIRVGPVAMIVRARDAEGEERARLFEALCALYPPLRDYPDYAGDREIPVVVLEPVPGAA